MITEVKSQAARVDGPDEVRVKVVIGNGQAGGWAIQVGPKLLKGDDAEDHPIGTGPQVRAARVVQVSTVVRDIRPETDRLSATVTLSANGSPPSTIAHARDGAPGDAAEFTSIFVIS